MFFFVKSFVPQFFTKNDGRNFDENTFWQKKLLRTTTVPLFHTILKLNLNAKLSKYQSDAVFRSSKGFFFVKSLSSRFRSPHGGPQFLLIFDQNVDNLVYFRIKVTSWIVGNATEDRVIKRLPSRYEINEELKVEREAVAQMALRAVRASFRRKSIVDTLTKYRRRFLKESKLLYKIRPPKLVFCTAIFLSLESLGMWKSAIIRF